MAATAAPSRWTPADSQDLYNIRGWGNDYFSINNEGHMVVHPGGQGTPAMDLKELVDEVRERGIGLPLLIRFSEIIKARVVQLNEAFGRAMSEYGYKGSYRGVYPIKVNQDRYLVERLVEYGRPYHYGLEAGSKPELLAVMAMLEDEEAIIVCNGYKDEEYIETALLASKLGRKVILVVEKPSELPLIQQLAQRTGVRPRIGIRSRLSTRGAGHWEASGGDRSKFGLSGNDLLDAIAFLRDNDLLDTFELLHFHLGSQISSIRSVKDGLREAAQIYVNLVRMGASSLSYLDVGGGLGVDYDGSQTNFTSSLNYTLQEYANDIVYGVMEVCDREEVPHPILVSESGRATVAHHAVLVIDVLDVSEFSVGRLPKKLPADAEPPLRNLFETYREVSRKNVIEAYHDAIAARDACLTLFSLGHLSLENRGLAESLFWATCQKALKITRSMAEVPEELEGLERSLADTYFCNFSVFQSLPDSWAIDQLFPIVPIHRLNEEPSNRAVLADITCDSDGKIDHFIDRRDVKDVLELHPFTGEPYYLGAFLVGAYQEILGDLHNLFGDTNTVHVALDAEEGYQIEGVVNGDTVTDVLRYVRYDRDQLVARVRKASETALRAKRMTLEESRTLVRRYEEGLSGYTYLEQD